MGAPKVNPLFVDGAPKVNAVELLLIVVLLPKVNDDWGACGELGVGKFFWSVLTTLLPDR
jgi:hypothetical protein